MCKKEENMQQVWYKEQLKNIKPNSGLYSNLAVMYALRDQIVIHFWLVHIVGTKFPKYLHQSRKGPTSLNIANNSEYNNSKYNRVQYTNSEQTG